MSRKLIAILCMTSLMAPACLVTQAQEAVSEAVSEAAVEAVSPDEQDNMAQVQIFADTEISGWHIVVEGFSRSRSLENISVALGYSGVETTEYKKEADEGKEFAMVKLLIEKKGSREAIEWPQMKLVDENGVEYQRIGDEFILDLGMKRMPGTKLNFGSNEGWIAYEIPEEVEKLTLAYPFAEEEFNCSLTG